MRFSYCRASRVGADNIDFVALERAAEAIDLFCQAEAPLIPLQRTQRVRINSRCGAVPHYPLIGTGDTYRQPDGDSDLSITVAVRGGGTVLSFPATYASSEMDVTGTAGFGWTESAFALVGALSADAATLAETAAYDACEMGDALQLGDELLLVEAKETSPNQLRLIRGAGGTTAAAHDAGAAALFVLAPQALRDSAAKVAQVVISRRRAPGKGMGREQPGQNGARPVWMDWLTTVEQDLLAFQARPGAI